MEKSLDNSAFIGDEFDLKSKSSLFRQTIPPDSVRSLRKPSHTYKTRDSMYKKTLTKTMIGEALDDTIADKTLDEQSFSGIDYNEHSMFDMTQDLLSEELAVNAKLQEKVLSLEGIIASYQAGIQEKRPPDMMTLHQHLLELKQLRIQLEKSMHNNENLDRLLDDLASSSKSTVQSLRREIQDLHNQLAESQHSIKEKVQRITEKERLLSETNTTLAQQDRQLFEKSLKIEQLTQEWNEKIEMIRVQDEERAAMRASVASGNMLNKKLSTQLEQQRFRCANYKRQVDGQNHAMKDLKDKRRADTAQGEQKLDMDKQKELQETTRMRDKYLYNLKLMHKEFVKSKRDLQEMCQKFQNTSALNKSLTVELTVREKLQDKGDMLTDDDKVNIIQELLNELKSARVQMTDILEQNGMIKQKMGQFLKENEAAKQSGRSSGTSMETGQSRLTEEFLEAQGSPAGANVTWPLFDDGLQYKNYFSVQQGISDHCLLYNVNDSPTYVAVASTLDIASRAKTNLQDKSPPRNKPIPKIIVSSPRK